MADRPDASRLLEIAVCVALAGWVLCSDAAAQGRPEGNAAFERAFQLSEAFSEVLDRVAPAVVLIAIEAEHDLPPAFRVPSTPADNPTRSTLRPAGTGVLVRADGHLVTSQPLVAHAARIEVTLKDGRSFPAQLIGHDPASISLSSKSRLKAYPAGPNENMAWTYAPRIDGQSEA